MWASVLTFLVPNSQEKTDHFCVSQMLGQRNFLMQRTLGEKKNLSWFFLRAPVGTHFKFTFFLQKIKPACILSTG